MQRRGDAKKVKEKSCSIPSGRPKSKSKQQKAAAEVVGGTESILKSIPNNTASSCVGSLKSDSNLDSDIVGEGDDTALQAAIEEAASSAAGADGTKEIMEDDDDYD